MELEKVKHVKNYEVVIILKPDANEERQKALFKKNQGIIESCSGKIHHVESWGTRALANPIKKQKRGHYFYSTFNSFPEAIAELERTMRINEDVLRFMHTKLSDKVDLAKHLEQFHESLREASKREREKELKRERKIPPKG